MKARQARPLVIFGAGGHGRELAQIVTDINRAQGGPWRLLGFVADCAPPPEPLLPAPFLGDAAWLAQQPEPHVVVAVGDPESRRALVHRLRQQTPGRRFATLIHPRAWLADGVVPGEGSVVFAGCLLNVDVRIGVHASLNLGCTLSHDVVLGDFVSLGPGVHLAGGTHVGSGADIGAGAASRPRARVGTCAVVGAGAVVVHPVPDGCTVVGVPAR